MSETLSVFSVLHFMKRNLIENFENFHNCQNFQKIMKITENFNEKRRTLENAEFVYDSIIS